MIGTESETTTNGGTIMILWHETRNGPGGGRIIERYTENLPDAPTPAFNSQPGDAVRLEGNRLGFVEYIEENYYAPPFRPGDVYRMVWVRVTVCSNRVYVWSREGFRFRYPAHD